MTKPHALYKKPHALYSLRPSGFGRQGCGFNPSPNALRASVARAAVLIRVPTPRKRV